MGWMTDLKPMDTLNFILQSRVHELMLFDCREAFEFIAGDYDSVEGATATYKAI